MKELFNTISEKDSKLLKKPYNIKKDKFWYNNPSILINYERLSEFFPTSDMTIEEQLNLIQELREEDEAWKVLGAEPLKK